jgi:hypothetical protein
VVVQSAAAQPTYTIFDPVRSTQTYPQSINDTGAITGTYYVGGTSHGFVRAADGTITSFDPPGSINTYAYSINSTGAIAGAYEDSHRRNHGFERAADGTITSFDPLGSTATIPFSINENSGTVTTFPVSWRVGKRTHRSSDCLSSPNFALRPGARLAIRPPRMRS